MVKCIHAGYHRNKCKISRGHTKELLSYKYISYASSKTHWLYGDVIMDAIASQITSLVIVYSAFYSGADQRKHQTSASLAFVRGIRRGLVNSRHKWPITRKMFPFDDVIMEAECRIYTSVKTKPWAIQIMACRMFTTKPLSEPMLPYFQWDHMDVFQLNLFQI